MCKLATWIAWSVFVISGASCYWNNDCPLEYRCSRVLKNIPQPSCFFNCCHRGRWHRGMIPDGTRCKLQRQGFGIGQCNGGFCVPSPGSAVPGQPSYPRPSPPGTLLSCNEIPNPVGYTEGCTYSCRSFSGSLETQTYPGGTRCLMVSDGPKKRVGPAGLCSGEQCIPHYEIGGEYSTVMSKVFPLNLYRCPEKVYLGRNAVFDCHHYCKEDGLWFHGSYMGNTTCQTDTLDVLGWCCKGKCHAKMWCGMTENSLDDTLG